MELMDPRHIDPDLVDQMLSPAVSVNKHYSWGLGIGLQTGGSEDAIWQWGNNSPSHMSLAVIYRTSKTGVIVMMDGKKASEIYADIVHQAIGGPRYGFENTIDFVFPKNSL